MKHGEGDLSHALDRARQGAGDTLARIHAELRVAAFLAERHPDRARAWRARAARAARAVETVTEAGAFDRLPDAVREAERILAPLGQIAKTYTIHLVGHAHIDMNWMWSWPETVAVTNDTVQTVLRLMEEFPAFRFSQSQASIYAILETYRPDLLDEVRRRVAEGRWEVTASHWVENDANLAGPEALHRHLLYTRDYMSTLFALAPEDVPVYWAPDTFGHPHRLPSCLTRGAIRFAYLHRPGGEGPVRDGAFWWAAPDGRRVLVHNDVAAGYNGIVNPEALLDQLVRFAHATDLRDLLFVYGVGDHGGGPTRRDVRLALAMQAWPIFPTIAFSTARRYFEVLEPQAGELPVHDGELNPEMAGCYTSQSLIKKANRRSENGLADAETAAALAWAALGRSVPANGFRRAWCDTLFTQFHDILPGSGVHDTRTYAHGRFQDTMAFTGVTETEALRALARQVCTADPDASPASGVGTAGPGAAGAGFGSTLGGISQAARTEHPECRPLLIFNPLAWAREEVIEATVWAGADDPPGEAFTRQPFAVRGPDGRLQPAQVVDTGRYWSHDYATLAFPVRIPSMGYAVYTVLAGVAAGAPPAAAVRQAGRAHHCAYARHEREPEGLEHASLRLELDPATGGIARLVHKPSGLTVVDGGAQPGLLEYAVERPHAMSAWLIDHAGPVSHPRVTGVRRRHEGPWTAAIEVSMRIEASDFTLTYALCAGDPRLHLRIRGTWFERGSAQTGVPVLRLALPFAFSRPRARFEVPFGVAERADWGRDRESPALQWAMVSGRAGGKAAGCLVLNDGKHGHAMEGATLRVSLVRSSYDPDPLPEIGEQDARFALLPYAGRMPPGRAVRHGRDFNHALRAVPTDLHDGPWPMRASFLRAGPDALVLHSVKKAEREDGLVLGFFDPTGRAAVGRAVPDRAMLGKVRSVTEVDPMERPLGPPQPASAGNAVRVAVPAHGQASVLVRLDRAGEKGKNGASATG